MGNCFSIRKGKTTAFSVEWPFRLCAWTTNKKNTIKYSMGKHSELDSPLCYSSSAPDWFSWTKMELYHPYYLRGRGLILPLTKILVCREWALLIHCGERITVHGNPFYGCIGWMSWRIKIMKKILPQSTETEDVCHMVCVLYTRHDVSWCDMTCFMKNHTEQKDLWNLHFLVHSDLHNIIEGVSTLTVLQKILASMSVLGNRPSNG